MSLPTTHAKMSLHVVAPAWGNHLDLPVDENRVELVFDDGSVWNSQRDCAAPGEVEHAQGEEYRGAHFPRSLQLDEETAIQFLGSLQAEFSVLTTFGLLSDPKASLVYEAPLILCYILEGFTRSGRFKYLLVNAVLVLG